MLASLCLLRHLISVVCKLRHFREHPFKYLFQLIYCVPKFQTSDINTTNLFLDFKSKSSDLLSISISSASSVHLNAYDFLAIRANRTIHSLEQNDL